MKVEISLPFAAKAALALASSALLLTGCSRSPSTADTAPADVRGEPIAPAARTAEATNPAAAPEVPAAVAAVPATPPAETTPAVAATNSVASVAPGVTASNAAPAEATRPGFAAINFDRLASFDFVMPDETISTNGIVSNPSSKAADQIPTSIKSLDRTAIALKGFMLPLKVEAGLVTEMLIMRDQSMCCYGKVPKINEWVSVKMADKGVKAVMDQPVTIYGKLHVGEMRENGYLVGIYRIDGEAMSVPEL